MDRYQESDHEEEEKIDDLDDEEEESESFEVQFARYLSNTKHQNQKAYIKVMINPMKVWNSEAAKKKIGDFRQVRDVALRILSIQASSVEPESLFSDLKFMVKARQSRMKPKNVNARICLKRWVMAGLVDKSIFKAKSESKMIQRKVRSADPRQVKK